MLACERNGGLPVASMSRGGSQGDVLCTPTKSKGRASSKSKGIVSSAENRNKATLDNQPSSADTPNSRALRPRSTNEQADRAIESKLGEVDPLVLDAKTNAKGQTLRQVVANEIRATRGQKQYLPSKFWIQQDKEFCIFGNPFESLPAVPDNEDVCDEIVSAVMTCHHENPATRSTDQLEHTLEYKTDVNRSELTFMLNASVQGPVISRQMAHRMRVIIMDIVGRLGLFNVYQDVWEVIRSCMDLVMHEEWVVKFSKAPKGLFANEQEVRESFMDAHGDKALKPFMPRDLVKAVEDSFLGS